MENYNVSMNFAGFRQDFYVTNESETRKNQRKKVNTVL